MRSLTWIQILFHRLHGHQQKSLACFVDALLVEQRVGLAHIARRAAAWTGGRMRAALKRVWRLLGNPRFDDDVITEGLIDWIWPRTQHWKFVPISIDWTHNEKRDPWATLAVSISLRGRGIPLMMWSFPKAEYEEHLSRNRCEEAFIRHLWELLSKDGRTDRVVLLADRGFGRTALLDWLTAQEIPFVIRVPRSGKVRSKQHVGHLRDLVVNNGECYSLGALQYTDSHAFQLPNLVVAREGQKEQYDPWFLATNVPAQATTITKLYARRMIIEQDFKEAKSRLDWSDSRIRKPEHYRRLTTLVILVLAFATLVGRVARGRPTLAGQVARRRKGAWDHSCTAIGLLILRLSLKHLALLHQIKFPAQPI